MTTLLVKCTKRHLDSSFLYDVIPEWSLKRWKDNLYLAQMGQNGEWEGIVRRNERLNYLPIAPVICALAAECVGGYRDVSGAPTRISDMAVHNLLSNASSKERLVVLLEDNHHEGMIEWVADARPRWMACVFSAIPDTAWRDRIARQINRTDEDPPSSAVADAPPSIPPAAPPRARKPGQPPSYSPPPADTPSSSKPSTGKRIKSLLGLGE